MGAKIRMWRSEVCRLLKAVGGDRQCSDVSPGAGIAAAGKWDLSRNFPLEKRQAILL